MSRRSTVTARERPVAASASSTGRIAVHAETFTIPSENRIQILDITDRVMQAVAGSGVGEGLVHLCSMHTTCSVFVNEFQPALMADVRTFLERVVGTGGWKHDDPAYSDCDRSNADAHLRATLLGPGLTLQVSGGELVLGQWQRVLLAELDGPRTRSVRLMVMGISIDS
jgi:secondary thiamine-phosphate synthase enzyme